MKHFVLTIFFLSSLSLSAMQEEPPESFSSQLRTSFKRVTRRALGFYVHNPETFWGLALVSLKLSQFGENFVEAPCDESLIHLFHCHGVNIVMNGIPLFWFWMADELAHENALKAEAVEIVRTQVPNYDELSKTEEGRLAIRIAELRVQNALERRDNNL